MQKTTTNPKAKHHPTLFLTLIVMIVASVVFGFSIAFSSLVKRKNLTFPNIISPNKYYAVFLSNGQVYFGHLNKYYTSKNPVLYDIYYLQAGQELQAAEKKEGEAGQFNLVKLGQELHGPEDVMVLNKDQILFVEQLKDDGQVVKAVTEHKKEKK